MPRPPQIDHDQLMQALLPVFRNCGYEGASLETLARAAGLKKASLYHRFPGGKEEIARSVLTAAREWLEREILEVLRQTGSPKVRLKRMVDVAETFYDCGREACILNVFLLGDPQTPQPFTSAVGAAFSDWKQALVDLAREAGVSPKRAASRALHLLALLQGAIVLTRATADTASFVEFRSYALNEFLKTTPT